MADIQHYTEAEIAYQLRRSHGRIYRTAAKMGVNARTIQNYMKRYPDLRRVCKEARGRILDFTEGKLWQAIKAGEQWAIKMELMGPGRHRGYQEEVKKALASGVIVLNIKENIVIQQEKPIEPITEKVIDGSISLPPAE